MGKKSKRPCFGLHIIFYMTKKAEAISDKKKVTDRKSVHRQKKIKIIANILVSLLYSNFKNHIKLTGVYSTT